ncbi:hypothetical protein AB1Y20_019099 [Prymnesium parvum]|uniref:Uncharacterized protein n=1 Tax=Prymnesium parvum TaxID=97485 RepID=A0AB34JU78_PRYPA
MAWAHAVQTGRRRIAGARVVVHEENTAGPLVHPLLPARREEWVRRLIDIDCRQEQRAEVLVGEARVEEGQHVPLVGWRRVRTLVDPQRLGRSGEHARPVPPTSASRAVKPRDGITVVVQYRFTLIAK